MSPMITRRVARRDDPGLDLVAHARAVVRGAAKLDAEARREMIAAIGIEPDPDTNDIKIATHYLARCGVCA